MTPQIHRITYYVPSATTPGIVYRVSAPTPDAPLACDCKASEYPKTRGRCWHISAIRSGLIKPRVSVSV